LRSEQQQSIALDGTLSHSLVSIKWLVDCVSLCAVARIATLHAALHTALHAALRVWKLRLSPNSTYTICFGVVVGVAVIAFMTFYGSTTNPQEVEQVEFRIRFVVDLL